MVALNPAATLPDEGEVSVGGPTRRRRSKIRVGRGLVLAVGAIYFLIPLYAGFKFGLQDTAGHFSFSSFTGIPSQKGFGAALWLSARLAVVTTIVTLALMIPTTVFIHTRAPGLRRLLDGITLLPIAIPPVVVIVGVLQVAPGSIKGTPYLLSLEYVVLAMPFAYRSLDAGLAAIDLKTLVEASRSLGGKTMTTLLRVVVPNLRSATLSATVLTVALVLGEFTMASLDQYQTFPVWVVAFEQDNAHVSVAVSLLALLITWILLIAISALDQLRRRRRPT